MLNINGATDDSSGFSVFYDYYGKMQMGGQDGTMKSDNAKTLSADIWS